MRTSVPYSGWRRTATCPSQRLRWLGNSSLWVALLLLLAAAAPCRAQEDDQDDDAAPAAFASLTLNLDRSGGVEADLILDAPPANWQPIQAALGQALHCSAGSFSNPASRGFEDELLRKAPAKRRADLQKLLSASRLRQLHGKCSDALRVDGWVVAGDIPLQTLALALANEGKQSLIVRAQRPVTAFEEHTPAQSARSLAGNDYLTYEYSLNRAAAVSDIHLAYGFRRSDLIQQSVVSFGFLLLPLIITLWMRRAALKDAVEDPTAAWFSYFKTLQWCINGTMLLWMVARTSIRQGLETLIAFRLGDLGWQSALARTAATMVPPWLVYLLCLAFSYEIFVRVRGNRWKRHEFLLNQFFTLGAQFFPLMFFFSAIDFLHAAPKGTVLFFAAAYFSRVICVRGAARISGSAPEALTTGELRDRIFELAKKAGVEIKHLFVLSAGKSQIANAFAAKSSIVIFTDYLLQRMSKREVDAIAGHELTHLRLGHPKKLGLILVGAVLAPTLFRVSWSLASSLLIGALSMFAVPSSSGVFTRLQFDEWLTQWPHLDLVLVVTGFAFFYLRARTFERAADAGSVQLVGDPEAMITGLLKLSRLNLMPIQWGKVTGSIMTHPSTLKRVEHIAKVGSVSPERLQEILAHHWQEQQAWRAANQKDSVLAPGEHYPIPESSQHVLNTAVVVRRATNSLWFLTLGHVVPPALVVVLVNKLALQGWAAFAAYAAGAVVCVAAYSLLTVLLGLRGRKQLRAAFVRKFGQEGIAVSAPTAVLMGFSPGSTPRFYLSSYNWDTGFFLLLRDRIVFVGEKILFALKPEQIVSIRPGPGGPGWWNSGRVYVDWRDTEKGREGTFNLLPHEPITIGKIKSEGSSLLQRLQNWQRNPASYPEAQSPLLTLESPALGEVTSQSPKEILRGPKANAIAVMMFLVGYGVATLLSISPWYLFGVIVLLRIYEQIPYWRYRETQAPAMRPPATAARAQVGGAR